MKISIIIPVYNAAQYLKECLESVLTQTIKEIEVICINDGSTDDSLEILNQFQQRDSRILIVDQKNHGVSAARNAGLKIATGKYLGFVDADDTIEKEYFEILFSAAEENRCEIIYSKFLANEKHLATNRKYNKEEIIQEILPLYLEKDVFNSIWNKLYLNLLIKQNDIQFPVGKKIGEDADFNLQILEFTENLFYLDYVGYHYREVFGSATRNVSVQNYLKDAVQLFNEEPIDFVKNSISPEITYQLKSRRLIHYVLSLVYIYSEPSNGISVIQKIQKISELVNDNTVSKVFSQNNVNSFSKFGRFQKQIYIFIKNRRVFPLYFLSLYSYYRNC